MTIKSKYVHTNLIAEDWRALSDFYQRVFGCVVVPPERNLGGEKLEAGTGIPGAALRGVHLRLPGYGDDGPTLEIFSYNVMAPRTAAAVNRLGFAHLAFSVDDVAVARQAVLAAGGSEVGQIVAMDIPGRGVVTWVYLADPEGNIVELQSWSRMNQWMRAPP